MARCGDKSLRTGSKKYLCDCEKHCKRLKEVSRSTYIRHAPYRTTVAFSDRLCPEQNPNRSSMADDSMADNVTGPGASGTLGYQSDAAPYSSVCTQS